MRAAASTEREDRDRSAICSGAATSRTPCILLGSRHILGRRWSSVEPVPRSLPRAYRRQLEALDLEKVMRLVQEAVDETPESTAGSTAGGDGRRLRGIPSVGRGVSGAIGGTDPLRALMAKERQKQQKAR